MRLCRSERGATYLFDWVTGAESDDPHPPPAAVAAAAAAAGNTALRWVIEAGETASVESALSGPNGEPGSQNVKLIGCCQSVRSWSNFLGLRTVVHA
jgi:hypothetical protein